MSEWELVGVWVVSELSSFCVFVAVILLCYDFLCDEIHCIECYNFL